MKVNFDTKWEHNMKFGWLIVEHFGPCGACTKLKRFSGTGACT